MKTYTHEEERANAVSHAWGIALGVIVSAYFIFFSSTHLTWVATLGISLYALGMLASYICSTIYHSLPQLSKAKAIARKWDHSAIYWHIAGSYSPIVLIALIHQSFWGWLILSVVWICAIVGTVISFQKITTHSHFKTACYIAMGLVILIAFKPLMDCVPTSTIWWLIGEGASFIIGAVFYGFKNLKFMHTVFHIFCLLGTICHMMAVWYILTM